MFNRMSVAEALPIAYPPTQPMSASAPIKRPLDGVKVLDLSLGLSGGYCTKMLRDLGAEVIKVEARGTGDDVRSIGPFPQ